jgi:pimeloyl-ACP methyl ester carboxylesterase
MATSFDFSAITSCALGTRRSVVKGATATALIAAIVPSKTTGAETEADMTTTRYDGIKFNRATVNGIGIHFQEAGDPHRPTLLLLHGFPSTSRMWDRLIPTLSPHYHIIAPDYPGFGLSDAPSPKDFDYTFDNLALIMSGLLRHVGIDRYSLVMQDYGGPVGFRMALSKPNSLQVIAAQNLAAYEEALGPIWNTRKAFWAHPTTNRAALDKNLLSIETARGRHIGSSPNVELYDPNSWHDEYAMLNRPGMNEIHATLFYDYRNNVAAYPKWQAWLREVRPQMQVIWGRYDTSFTPQGALGFARDNSNTETHVIEAGHFPLDEAPDQVRQLTLAFLQKQLG